MPRRNRRAADEGPPPMRMPQPARSGSRVITLKDVDFSYGDMAVYRGLEFEAERGQRTVLVLRFFDDFSVEQVAGSAG